MYILNSIRGVETDDVQRNRSIQGKVIGNLRQKQRVGAMDDGTSRIIESRAEGYEDQKNRKKNISKGFDS